MNEIRINRKISGVLFDLDGTLLDTAPDLARSLNTLRERYKKPPLGIEQVREVASLGCPGLIHLGFDIDLNHPNYPELCRDFVTLYEADITAHTRPFEGIGTVLQTLKKNQIPWGVVTNKAEKLAKKILDNLALTPDCACLIGGDTTPFPKPAPDPLYAACKIIRLNPEDCLFIGDSSLDIQAAQRAKMPNIAALYGYIPNSCDPQAWEADYYVTTPIEILTCIGV
jgi:phosphoglycolate phosphatase